MRSHGSDDARGAVGSGRCALRRQCGTVRGWVTAGGLSMESRFVAEDARVGRGGIDSEAGGERGSGDVHRRWSNRLRAMDRSLYGVTGLPESSVDHEVAIDTALDAPVVVDVGEPSAGTGEAGRGRRRASMGRARGRADQTVDRGSARPTVDADRASAPTCAARHRRQACHRAPTRPAAPIDGAPRMPIAFVGLVSIEPRVASAVSPLLHGDARVRRPGDDHATAPPGAPPITAGSQATTSWSTSRSIAFS